MHVYVVTHYQRSPIVWPRVDAYEIYKQTTKSWIVYEYNLKKVIPHSKSYKTITTDRDLALEVYEAQLKLMLTSLTDNLEYGKLLMKDLERIYHVPAVAQKVDKLILK
jgi:hypothetical protein